MQLQEIKRIMKENRKFLDMLEEYDRTGHLPIEKVRRSFTIKRSTLQKLKMLSKDTGKPMSSIIDSLADGS